MVKAKYGVHLRGSRRTRPTTSGVHRVGRVLLDPPAISQSASTITGRNTTELSWVSSASANVATESARNRDSPSSRHLRNQSRLRHPNNAPIASASAPTQATASMSDGCAAKNSAVTNPYGFAAGPPEGGLTNGCGGRLQAAECGARARTRRGRSPHAARCSRRERALVSRRATASSRRNKCR